MSYYCGLTLYIVLVFLSLILYRTWALGLIYGHRAYGDPFFLPQAERQWEIAYPYFVTEADALAGKHPFRNVSISKTCTTLNCELISMQG
jgi:hypothetical protein